VEGSFRAKNQLDSSIRFDTIPACDTRTDRRTQDDSKYRASTASRGKYTCCVRCHDISSVCMFCVCSVQRVGRDEMRQHWSLYSHVVRLWWTRYMRRLDRRTQLQSVYFLSAYLYNPQSLKVYLQHMNWTERQFGTRVRELLRNISALALLMCAHMYYL